MYQLKHLNIFLISKAKKTQIKKLINLFHIFHLKKFQKIKNNSLTKYNITKVKQINKKRKIN